MSERPDIVPAGQTPEPRVVPKKLDETHAAIAAG
jgi:hypothetical protein